MNTALLWNNLVTYSLQIGLLVGLAAFVPTLVRMKLPHARLAYWQLLLLGCLALPLVRPWRQAVITVMEVTPNAKPIAAAPAAAASGFDLPSATDWLLLILAAGALARLAWLALGFWRLHHYRQHARPYELLFCPATVMVSDEISSPVTFGFRDPVILLPPRFSELSPAMQEAILHHETLHVERHDWLFTVGEELVRVLFWFHPAIWWLLGEIQLSREQAVDRCVIARTESRDPYVDALLTMAGAKPQLDLAPAPLFLRKRHLKQRVVGILKEVRMSKTRWISALAAGLAIMAAACWFVTGAIPLAAAPQIVADAAGVAVNTNGAVLMHRVPVAYPTEAINKGIEGTVVVQVKLDANGEVNDASIVSGPDELRRTVLQSVLSWHFAKEDASTTRLVNVDFTLLKGVTVGSAAVPSAVASIPATRSTLLTSGDGSAANLTVKNIEVVGLSDSAQSELLAHLTVHVGDTITAAVLPKIMQEVKQFDSHLQFGMSRAVNGDFTLRILAPGSSGSMVAKATAGGVMGGMIGSVPSSAGAPPPPPAPGEVPQRIRVGGNVQAENLVSGPKPAYPPLAKQAKISGTVELAAIIGKDGTIIDLKVISGHPLLVQASLDAVKDWVYRPTLLNGNPVEVSTTIDVNFTLSQ